VPTANGKRSVESKSENRLGTLAQAHLLERRGPSPRIEDYLEMIYELLMQKGYAKSIDIATYLHVSPPSVTSMLRRLDDAGLLHYEKHRGITLTEEGERLAKGYRLRHGTLARFLELLGVDNVTAHVDTEGLEHHVHPMTIKQIEKFVRYADENPKWIKQFVQNG
jgi:DtxR family transcriptional regulator, manganese transport regulator